MTYAEGREILRREHDAGSLDLAEVPSSSSKNAVCAFLISTGDIMVLTQIPPQVLSGGVFRYHVYSRGEI